MICVGPFSKTEKRMTQGAAIFVSKKSGEKYICRDTQPSHPHCCDGTPVLQRGQGVSAVSGGPKRLWANSEILKKRPRSSPAMPFLQEPAPGRTQTTPSSHGLLVLQGPPVLRRIDLSIRFAAHLVRIDYHVPSTRSVTPSEENSEEVITFANRWLGGQTVAIMPIQGFHDRRVGFNCLVRQHQQSAGSDPCRVTDSRSKRGSETRT